MKRTNFFIVVEFSAIGFVLKGYTDMNYAVSVAQQILAKLEYTESSEYSNLVRALQPLAEYKLPCNCEVITKYVWFSANIFNVQLYVIELSKGSSAIQRFISERQNFINLMNFNDHIQKFVKVQDMFSDNCLVCN